MNNDKTIKRFESFPVWFWTNLANVESSQFNFEKVLAAKTAWVLENRGQMLRSGKTGKTHVATSCNFWVKTAGKDWNLSVQTTRCSFQQHFQNRAKESQRMAAAAMAITNFKRRTTQLQQEKSQDQPNNFSHQSTQGSIFSRPSPDFTVSANPNGTKKWSCDGDGVTINTKWFPSTTSR